MKCENCGYYYYNEEYDREMCNFPPVDSLYSTPWDVAPCEEEHEEPSDDPELWDDEESEENEMGWTDKYSKDDVELIINELLYFTMARRGDDYNEGWMEGSEVLTFLTECGFTEEDATAICNDNGIDVEGSEE